ncbi:MAG: ATP phosphoribosyltransferase [Fusobacteriaceae bacterium]
MERIRIAIQKSGRMSDDSIELLKKCGLEIPTKSRQLLCHVQNFPIDILFVRDDNISSFVSEGICDLGIVGKDVYTEDTLALENKLSAEIKFQLGFSKCRLSIAVPDNFSYEKISDIKNLKIATSYPEILKKYLAENKVEAEVIKMEGSVEAATHFKIADLICDIVSSGATLEANGLKEFSTVMKSEALLIQTKNPKFSAAKIETLEKLFARIQSVMACKDSKYVMLNAPREKISEITKLLTGADSPTIIDLADKNKVAIHAVCNETKFWEMMEELKKVGATAILILPIEKMML